MTLKEMRDKAGLSQVMVAECIGDITQGAISQWEKGLNYPHPQKLTQLARLYEVSEREIIEAITAAKGQKNEISTA